MVYDCNMPQKPLPPAPKKAGSAKQAPKNPMEKKPAPKKAPLPAQKPNNKDQYKVADAYGKKSKPKKMI